MKAHYEVKFVLPGHYLGVISDPQMVASAVAALGDKIHAHLHAVAGDIRVLLDAGWQMKEASYNVVLVSKSEYNVDRDLEFTAALMRLGVDPNRTAFRALKG